MAETSAPERPLDSYSTEENHETVPEYTPAPVPRHRKPAKPILKQPSPPRQGFNFRRDILEPINSRLTSYEASSTQPIAATFLRSALGRFTIPQSSEPSVHTDPTSSSRSSAPLDLQSQGGESLNQPPSAQIHPQKIKDPFSVKPLKSVRFTVSSLAVVYPIHSIPPGQEAETRDRVNSEHRARNLLQSNSSSWTGRQLLDLYEECCLSREEFPLSAVRRVFSDQKPATVLDLSHVHLSPGGAFALSDILSVKWGLKRLVLDDCDLTEEKIKPILHSLLDSGTPSTLIISRNKRLKARGWQYISIFIRKSHSLCFLDISNITLDRRALEPLMQALSDDTLTASSLGNDETPTTFGKVSTDTSLTLDHSADMLKDDCCSGTKCSLKSIKIDGCNLKTHQLEMIAHGLRITAIENISLRNNRINALGAVALAILMRDYEIPSDSETQKQDEDSTNRSFTAIDESYFQAGNSVTGWQPSTEPANHFRPSAPTHHTSNTQGTTDKPRTRAEDASPSLPKSSLIRQIDSFPTVSRLVTLDVKSNDIRQGSLYIAQALKRNRTLKVLNLSDNKIDSAGLSSIAEALKYNSTLETLDMSYNPCCGTNTAGVNNLRAAFMYNTSIMRVFLSSTELTSEGAISLAEFLPEVKSLFHLDITENYDIDIAGVMALAKGVKLNKTLRCLDLNIPSNNADFARLSQEILQSCIRNTELAQEELDARGIQHNVSAPIHRSAMARDLKTREQKLQESKRRRAEGQIGLDDMVAAASDCRDVLMDLVRAQEEVRNDQKAPPNDTSLSVLGDVASQAQVASVQLQESVDPSEWTESMTLLCEELKELGIRTDRILNPPAQISPVKASNESISKEDTNRVEANTSPFSIADSETEASEESDHESDPEEPMDNSAIYIPESDALDQKDSRKPHVLSISTAIDSSPNTSPRSPVEDQSRSLTLEEGEVFRKGAALGAASDDETSAEELKKEILSSEVDRSPRSSLSTISSAERNSRNVSPSSRSSVEGDEIGRSRPQARRRSSSSTSSTSSATSTSRQMAFSSPKTSPEPSAVSSET